VRTSYFREVWNIAKPLVLQYLFESVLYVADTLFVAGLGKIALDAVATALYLCYLIQYPMNACLLSSFTTYVSQAWGSRDLNSIVDMFGKAFTTALLAGSLSATISYTVSRYLIEFVYPSAAVVKLGLEYFKYVVLAFPGSSLFITYMAFLYGIGRTRDATICWIMSDIINIILDPLLIYTLRMGVVGAALAFVISIYSVIPFFHIILRRYVPLRIRIRRPDMIVLKLVKNVGLPISVERAVVSLLYTSYAAIIGRYGVEAYTAYQLGLRIESFIYMPLLAYRDTANILIGQRVGAERIEELPEILRTCELLAVATVVVASVLTLGFTLLLMNIMLPELFEHIQTLVLLYLLFASLSDVGLALKLSCIGAYQAIGKTLISTVVDIASMGLLRVVPSLAFYMMRLPILAVWLTMSIDTATCGLALTLLFVKRLYREPVKFVKSCMSEVSS